MVFLSVLWRDDSFCGKQIQICRINIRPNVIKDGMR